MKKITDSWFKNKTWNGDIDTRFEKQLRYTRNPIHKAAYLLVQGSLLLENPNENIQEVGQVLLSRLIEDLPTEHSPILTAQEKLGDYFFKKQQYEKAAAYYKIVVQYCVQQQSRTNTSFITDLKWAETFLKMNRVDCLEEAYQLVARYPVSLLKLNEQKFYYAELGALICHKMYKITAAKEFAAQALKLAAAVKPVPGKNNKALISDARLQMLALILEANETDDSETV